MTPERFRNFWVTRSLDNDDRHPRSEQAGDQCKESFGWMRRRILENGLDDNGYYSRFVAISNIRPICRV
jgi:hypothetical protein